MRTWLGLVMACAVLFGAGRCVLYAAKGKDSEATITSDELEIRDNGDQTLFRGHVVLKDNPYLLHSKLMIRAKATGDVTASGNIDGTWRSDKGEIIKAYGEEAFYKPKPPVTEMWGGSPHLVRWETVRDTAPVQISADRFVAHHDEREFFAEGHVVITQKPKLLTRSDKAKYEQTSQTIYLYGPRRIYVHVADSRGIGDFTSEKGEVTLSPKTAQMSGHVQGHIDPGQNSL